jgi:hypothetical protein
MDDISDQEVFDAMVKYGGGFVSALGVAWRKADPENSDKLKAVFWAYFDSYKAMAIEQKRREQAKA